MNEVRKEQPVQASQEVRVVPEQHGGQPQVKEAPAPQVEQTHQAKAIEVVGGSRNRRLQKLNRAEEEVGFKKRR